MQYFAQDEANRLPPTQTVYEVMEADSSVGMVPMIRNILGGFLFSGDDIYKRAGVLSGGERTRLAVARMLLRPANTLLLDEPTNHLDLDSKDVLLEALEDFGGTLIFVSHDRYFVDRLANKIVVVGKGAIETYPGTYEQFLWSRIERSRPVQAPPERKAAVRAPHQQPRPPVAPPPDGSQRTKKNHHAERPAQPTYQDRKKADSDDRRRRREAQQRERRIIELEALIADRERSIKDLEASMAAAGFYDDRAAAESAATRHQALMWEVGDLMHQWETLQNVTSAEP
jgi:ATP-binding cassette subfamily F protein 3